VTKPRVTAVLSGGGAKAAAHIGAHRALVEAGLSPERYVATSMGAVIAAALASGLGADALLARLVEVGRQGIVRATFAPIGGLYLGSLLQPLPLRKAIAEVVPARSFAELEVPLTVTTVDLDTGALTAFGAGGADAPLLDVLSAACALPMFYPPVVIAGHRHADGGLRAVLPLETAAAFGPELVVAVDIGPGFDEEAAPPPRGMPAMVRAHSEASGILMAVNTAAQLALWRSAPGLPALVYVRPRIERHATFRVERMSEYAAEGHRATAAALEAHAGRS
jgi:predicted acylesterase/phospholipase RssA